MPIKNKNVVNGIPRSLDTRSDLGIGNLNSKFFKQRPVSSGGFGIYNEKGPYDDEDKDNYEDFLLGKDKEEETKNNRFKSKLNRMKGASDFRDATDSMPFRDKGSHTPHAADRALSSSNNI